jgi:hypothetical protein
MAHNWRAHPSICSSILSSLGYAKRRSLRLERECRVPAQPVFDLCDRDELQARVHRANELQRLQSLEQKFEIDE